MKGKGFIVFALLLSCVGWLVITESDAEGRRRRRRKSRRFGLLQLISRTDGAAVSIDGDEVGVIPLGKPLRLKRGRHTLKITKKGYTQYLDVIRIRGGRKVKLDIDLLPMAGVLRVATNVPEALVYVDGRFVGTAPVEVETLVGERAVRVSKPGFHDFITTLKSVGGSSRDIVAQLKALPVGSSPYRPAPPPPPKWYQKWYVWAGAAAGVTAVAVAIVVPVLLTQGNALDDFAADFRYEATAEGP